MPITKHMVASALVLGMAWTSPVAADSAAAGTSPGVSIELSTAQAQNGACQLSFVVTNRHPTGIARAVYEVVLFDADGRVDQMSLLDFQDLPAGRARVRQFAFDGADCAGISRILINGASTCEGVADGACITGMTLSSRAETELVG